jgi:hypothetical protein
MRRADPTVNATYPVQSTQLDEGIMEGAVKL